MSFPRPTACYLITQAGPARFEIPAGKDSSTVVALLEDEGAGVRAADTQGVGPLTARLRARPGDAAPVLTVDLVRRNASIYGEWELRIAAADLDALTWDEGQTTQALFLDLEATVVADDVTAQRAVRDAEGNYVFPVIVTRTLGGTA